MRKAVFLQRGAGTPDRRMELFADRFLVHNTRVRDLATGDDVTLVVSPAGAASEQRQWMERCDRLARVRHRAVAALLDYGAVGEHRRFEAWRCSPAQHATRAGALRAHAMAA